jgi:hypothetical protein
VTAQLAKAIATLGEGDRLIVTKPDRLARSRRNLLNTLAAIGDKGASFKSLSDAWADTTTPAGKLMLTVLGGLAEYERHLILATARSVSRTCSRTLVGELEPGQAPRDPLGPIRRYACGHPVHP